MEWILILSGVIKVVFLYLFVHCNRCGFLYYLTLYSSMMLIQDLIAGKMINLLVFVITFNNNPFSAYGNWWNFLPLSMLINFKQYNPSKPGNYRLLYRSICDSEVQYTYFSLSYAGKPDEEYYVTWADNYTKFLVENVIWVAGSNSFNEGS